MDEIVKDGLTVRDVLKDVVSVPVKEDKYSFEYVGYCYSKAAKDVVFFLPKVVLTGEINEESGDDTIFGASPQEIIDFESEAVKSKFTEEGCKEYKEFLSTLSIWIYRTISVYKQTHNDNILENKEYQSESRGKKQKHNTLLVIYFSILNYIREIHGFSFEINIQYPLISCDKLKKSYIDRNLGCRRLKQIKYKYFSDKALRIWDLCYAFFDREYKIAMNRQAEDYLLAKDFERIFEVMIDTLVSGNDKQNLPKELTEQRDGKLVDHMFVGQGLIEQSDLTSELTYYIGDSKYYKRSKNDRTQLGDKSIYKQYTYARNVIQWNMNLFLDGDGNGEHPQLRDTLTEGYNPIPNFFISARIPNKKAGDSKFLSFDDRELKAQDGGVQLNRQFENRLFDRDTLLLCHYDVNFLYIVSLYGRNNKSTQAIWREYVRKEFRNKIQGTLNRLYTFRTLQPRDGMDCYQFIQDNFQRLNGKLYRPKSDSNYLILALMKDEDFDIWKSLKIKSSTIKKETAQSKELVNALQTHFYVSDPFELETEFHIDSIDNVGTLTQQPKQEIRNILTGLVRRTDADYSDFDSHTAKTYTMEKIPTSINVMDIRYFLPMVGGEIDGYYKVEKVYFGTKNGNLCLKLNLSSFISLGINRTPIYRIKMQPGELISNDLVVELYEQRIY